ncbi:MAG: hypothetical protein ACQEV6_09625 [Pseudomonadota bacterium]
MVKDLHSPPHKRMRLYLHAAGLTLSHPQREDLIRAVEGAFASGAVATDEHARSLTFQWCRRQQQPVPRQQPRLRRASMGYYRDDG